ncbi:ESX secretion-associated protein EspG [Nocardia uniformis]|uniref:ESX secretion-associated protein EspG n=1 Tax=Nocardia uniformis TaxID=53432 RepID=A0A849CEY9_9NOCA|nr:ESX secretion-associated protein EspG [Nocardia uniformis]NNH71891.1 ESX secretion-associated protein EspG [Nocardia uniformis]
MITLTNDGVIALASRLDIQTLPLVLSIAPQQDSYREWAAAQERAVAELTDTRVLDHHGEVNAETADALHILAQPDIELAVRAFSDDSRLRVCLARRGHGHAVAVRRGDRIDIRSVWSDGSGTALARPILEALGPCPPAEVASFSALATELSERLDAATKSEDYTDAVYGLGVNDRDATSYGLALASCHTYAEVVAYSHMDGLTDRSPGGVVVYDTARGRIVAASGLASDQQVWSTLTPGTDHRIAQAISALIESLPGGRWLP